MEFKNVIVTGGSGFIGSHLIDALVPVSKRVISIDDKKPRKAWKNPDAKYKLMDIRDERVADVFKKEKPDVVFHLAAHIHDRESVHEPVLNAQMNIMGSLNIFEAARRYAKKVVFISTGVVYGPQEKLPITIDTLPRPLTPYGISKLTDERYLYFYQKVYDLPFVAFRASNIYGPRQDSSSESGAVGIFSSRLLRGEQVYVNNDGKTTRDYLFISDLVAAFLKAATSDVTGVFNLGTGVETSTLDVFRTVSEAVGVQAEPEYREDVGDIPKHVALDVSETKKRFSWKPEVSFQQGVEQTVEWYRDHV